MKVDAVKTLTRTVPVTAIMVAQAYGSTGPDQREARRPPQEAFDACQGKSEGAAVEVTTPRGDVMKAICRSMGGELVAVPEGAPPGPASGVAGRGEGQQAPPGRPGVDD